MTNAAGGLRRRFLFALSRGVCDTVAGSPKGIAAKFAE